MTLLARVGLATSAGMARKRKYAIVGVFVVAAVFTPPDPLSQISLALPIIILYEASIYMAKLVEKKRAEQEAEEEGGDGGDVTKA
jgi:sec-independent protein translocase protein TatC